MADAKAVSRPLFLHTPILRGPDVRALQGSINEQYEHLAIDRQIERDGELGRETFDAARQVALCLGVHGAAQRKLERGTVSEATQKLIRGRRRTRREALVAKARAGYRRRLRRRYDRSAGEEAVEFGRRFLDTTESPAGSNKGPGITEWQVFTGYTWVKSASQGVFWCGCYACWVVVKGGGARIPERIRLGFAPFITDDARAGRNGLTAVAASQARPGDIACLWGGDHIEVVAEPPAGGYVKCIGGNTSQGGKDNNGGGVYENTRSLADFDGGIVARPDWN